MIRVLANTNMQGPHMGCALRACQGGSICFLHRNSVSSNRNTGQQRLRTGKNRRAFDDGSGPAAQGRGEDDDNDTREATDSQSAIEFAVRGSSDSANQQARNCKQVSFGQTACPVARPRSFRPPLQTHRFPSFSVVSRRFSSFLGRSASNLRRPPALGRRSLAKALSRRRVHGVHRRVLANQNAQLQSHANHAGHIRPSRTDRMLRHTKELRARMCHFVPLGPNTFTCARFFFISRTRERVRKST